MTLTVTSRTTRAELLDALQKQEKAHQAFRKTVVREAQKAAGIHGWCSVVTDTLRQIGLGDLLPAQYVVQIKKTSRSKWRDDDNWEPCDTQVEALDLAEQARDNDGTSEYISRRVTPDSLAEFQKDVARIVQALTPKTGTQAYPQYRVVKRGAEDEVVS